jgi:hypothetical protein
MTAQPIGHLAVKYCLTCTRPLTISRVAGFCSAACLSLALRHEAERCEYECGIGSIAELIAADVRSAKDELSEGVVELASWAAHDEALIEAGEALDRAAALLDLVRRAHCDHARPRLS